MGHMIKKTADCDYRCNTESQPQKLTVIARQPHYRKRDALLGPFPTTETRVHGFLHGGVADQCRIKEHPRVNLGPPAMEHAWKKSGSVACAETQCSALGNERKDP